jgi:hypothetical protein
MLQLAGECVIHPEPADDAGVARTTCEYVRSLPQLPCGLLKARMKGST